LVTVLFYNYTIIKGIYKWRPFKIGFFDSQCHILSQSLLPTSPDFILTWQASFMNNLLIPKSASEFPKYYLFHCSIHPSIFVTKWRWSAYNTIFVTFRTSTFSYYTLSCSKKIKIKFPLSTTICCHETTLWSDDNRLSEIQFLPLFKPFVHDIYEQYVVCARLI
jgi:hypothetical protein